METGSFLSGMSLRKRVQSIVGLLGFSLEWSLVYQTSLALSGLWSHFTLELLEFLHRLCPLIISGIPG